MPFNAFPKEHSAILLTCIKLPSVFKTFVFPNFERSLKTGLTVCILHGVMPLPGGTSCDKLCALLFGVLIISNIFSGPDGIRRSGRVRKKAKTLDGNSYFHRSC